MTAFSSVKGFKEILLKISISYKFNQTVLRNLIDNNGDNFKTGERFEELR